MENELIVKENETLIISSEIEEQIILLEKQAKEIKEKQQALKDLLLVEMETKNIKKVDTDVLSITYVEETDREKLDTKRLKEEHQELYDSYITMTKVGPSVRIKIK